ncbi:hypothetical protein ACEWY4_003539 [Coilia grayii]|uniref:TGF-beta family profile domain-containing protein n=1 Tax=Coilia grayii TaxID=363190 RepID=A0ABD1KSN4_9TELE
MAAAYLCALNLLVYLSSWKCTLVDASAPGWETLGSASERTFDRSTLDRDAQDVVTMNMYKIYDQYTKENRQRDGNTVRSFKATPVFSNNKVLFQFNLTSIPESEVVVAATLHFLEPPCSRARPWCCRRPRGPPCRPPPSATTPPPPRLLLRGVSGSSTAPPSRLATLPLPLHPHTRPHLGWLLRNVSAPLREALATGLRLLSAEFDPAPSERHNQNQHQRRAHWEHWARPSGSQLPYLLVYADDRAIGEPNSVATTLQRYGPVPATEERPAQNPTHTHHQNHNRPRREAVGAEHLQNNLLPEVQRHEDPKSRELWENTYFPLKPKVSSHGTQHTHSQTHTPLRPHLPDTHTGRDDGGSEGHGGSQVLRFDERTMKKARRRQWVEPRACARRYLRVDFADVGWSEWVLAPKAFDAFYCAGACRFPIPKVGRPSNHATIQSIVKAVGIIPGIPEPCCVPDKMSSLPVLYLDPERNLVLKVYPGMSVETCACR